VLQVCRQRIDQQAAPTERENLLAISQVLAKLRYNDSALLNIFEAILKDRFDSVPTDLASQLKAITDQERLTALFGWALRCPDLEAFRVRLAQSETPLGSGITER
jgi:hypothetical protein